MSALPRCAGACVGVDAAVVTGVDAAVAPPSERSRRQAASGLGSPPRRFADFYSLRGGDHE